MNAPEKITAAEPMNAAHEIMTKPQPGRGGVALYSLTTPVSNINEMGDVSLANEGKTAGVCDLAQTGSGSQAEDSPT